MLLFTLLYQAFSMSASQLDKTIYLLEGEQYKVNIDSIFRETSDNTYSFVSEDKRFTIDESNLKLKSEQGTYYLKPTKILRERDQDNLVFLMNMIPGHRICYNLDSTINLDQCIELDDSAVCYDFVFIARDTIAVSKIRITDQKFGVTIYKSKEIITEFYFVPSKIYSEVTQTILEYCEFGLKKYFLFGVTEEDSNIEFLEIQLNSQIVNINKYIDKSLLPIETSLYLFDIKGTLNKVQVVCKSSDESKLIVSFIFEDT